MICAALKVAFLRAKKYSPFDDEVHLNSGLLRIMNIHWCMFISRFQRCRQQK